MPPRVCDWGLGCGLGWGGLGLGYTGGSTAAAARHNHTCASVMGHKRGWECQHGSLDSCKKDSLAHKPLLAPT